MKQRMLSRRSVCDRIQEYAFLVQLAAGTLYVIWRFIRTVIEVRHDENKASRVAKGLCCECGYNLRDNEWRLPGMRDEIFELNHVPNEQVIVQHREVWFADVQSPHGHRRRLSSRSIVAHAS